MIGIVLNTAYWMCLFTEVFISMTSWVGWPPHWECSRPSSTWFSCSGTRPSPAGWTHRANWRDDPWSHAVCFNIYKMAKLQNATCWNSFSRHCWYIFSPRRVSPARISASRRMRSWASSSCRRCRRRPRPPRRRAWWPGWGWAGSRGRGCPWWSGGSGARRAPWTATQQRSRDRRLG